MNLADKYKTGIPLYVDSRVPVQPGQEKRDQKDTSGVDVLYWAMLEERLL